MLKRVIFMLLALCLLTAAAFAAQENPFIGAWIVEEDGEEITFIFMENGVFTGNKAGVEIGRGTYTVGADNTGELTVDESGSYPISLSDDAITVMDGNDIMYIMTRADTVNAAADLPAAITGYWYNKYLDGYLEFEAGDRFLFSDALNFVYEFYAYDPQSGLGKLIIGNDEIAFWINQDGELCSEHYAGWFTYCGEWINKSSLDAAYANMEFAPNAFLEPNIPPLNVVGWRAGESISFESGYYKAGKYAVYFNYSREGDLPVIVSLSTNSGTELECSLPATGTWANYSGIYAGDIELTDDDSTIYIADIEANGDYVMNLRSIVLTMIEVQ